MPLVAAIPAFLGTAAGAATVAGGLSLVGGMYAANQASNAADKQIAAQQGATQATLDLQRQQYDTTRADQAPYRQGGYDALDQILADYQVGSGAPAAQQSGQTNGGYDVAKYIQNNPDVAQRAQDLAAQGVIGPNGQWKTAEDWVGQVQLPNAMANGEQRDYPKVAAADPNAPAPQTAEQKLQDRIGEEPTYGPRETYTRDTYTRPGYQNADVSINAFQASPDYNYRLAEGNRNLNAAFGAKGTAGSGAAGKAFIDYGQNTANAEYGNWRNYVTGQTDKTNAFNMDTFNSDRAYGADAFSSDRAYGTNVYDADRGFSTTRYDTNRGYDTSRADKRTNDLFNIAGMGQGATNFTNQAGQTYANNASQAYQTSANVMSDIYGQQADNKASAFGQAIGGVQSAFNAFRSSNATRSPLVNLGSSTMNAALGRF